MRDVANYASCTPTISLPIYNGIQFFFFTEITRQITYKYMNYTQLAGVLAKKMPFYSVYNLRHRAHIYMCSFLMRKKRVFDLEGDLVGAPHAWHLSAQSFLTLIKLARRV